MKILTIVQARRGSTRLPDKVMMPVLGTPVLMRQLERIQQSQHHGQMVVATTTNTQDDVIAELCAANQIPCFRGHATDLLDRHYQAALHFGADAVVKIPSDCPLIDPAIIDQTLQYFIRFAQVFDYVSNLHPATWPDGNDVEIMHFHALEKAWKEATKDFEREHTTPYIWENPEKFRIGSVVYKEDDTVKDYSTSHRWTLDYQEDLDFIKRVYEELYPTNHTFHLNDILGLLATKPEIAAINQKYAGQYWYNHHQDELKHIDDKWKK